MGNLMVAVIGAVGYGGGLGKRGTSTDITLYNLKKGEGTVTFVEPARYPERLAPLFFACSVAKKAIVVVDELNSLLGESLVMLQCCGIESGYFVLRNFISRDKIEQLVKGTILEKYEFAVDNQTMLKEALIAEATQSKTSTSLDGGNPSGTVTVDHAFNVKGVGTVVLGVVAKGAIQKHGVMNVLPGAKATQIRSIQKNDDEFDFAYEGDRVGLALKNVEVGEVDRGAVLTSDAAVKASKRLKARASLVKYWSTQIKAGMVLHVGHWMQFLNGTVEEVSDEGDWREPLVTLVLEKELVYRSGDAAVLTYLEGSKLRVMGTLQLS